MEPQGTRGDRTGTQGTAVHGRSPRSPDWVSGMVVTSAMAVHSRVGPGLLERAYEAFLARELENRGLSVRRQVHLPLEAQLLSYLRLTGLRVGLLLNFHEVRLKHGITRMMD